ncbi:YheC/D-like protein [Alicyclobacillus sacchari]|uniref:YheC/D-like protein n=1 Tax=Alicyclobacillus sacchari TaxID=392010 RepID=A0A4R8LNZ8_9BACL|nr:YheC/YheD family protein [Alicyclobacillus sacchari]TDY46302.1 YheC/D-like protein [Alicyclobacillus sacchari]GMA57190.1 hypothetical protein GCM10025858_16930 [Alicyclobacillus sacchari]
MPRPTLDEQRYFLDKWQMYLAMQEAHLNGLHLPNTYLLPQISIQLLEQFSSWYIKPVETWGGNQIARVTRHASGLWRFESSDGESRAFSHPVDLLSVLLTMYVPERTIVQQTAPVLTLSGRPFDIRTLCQRDHLDAWIVAGHLARVGSVNSIVSNIGTGHGEVLPTIQLLRQVYQNRDLSGRVLRRLRRVSLDICRVLDTYAEFDEVGIDFGLDRHGRIWLFEVNTNDRLGKPSHELFLQLPDRRLYDAIEERAKRRQERWFRRLLRDVGRFHPS